MNLLEGLSNIFGGFGLNSPESKSENNKKWYDFSFLEDKEEKSAFETAKKEAESDEGMQLDDNVSSSYSSPLDTAKVKYGLNQTGYYDGDASTIPDQKMIDGVKKFQKDNNLHIDGMLKPEGETITTMNSKLKDFYTTKKYESGTEKGEKEYIRWQLKQNEKEKVVALAPKTQAKPKENDDWSFEPLKKTENRAKTENIFAPKSLIGEPKRKSLFEKSEPLKAPSEQIHEEKSREQQSLNLLERKEKNLPLPPKKPEYNPNNLLETGKKQIDYSKYGPGFSKEFIDEMENDKEFQQILKEYIIPNEGGYNNDPDDSGGETNMGIAKSAHSNEDIKNMTRERANAIYYRDYYKWNGLHKLPYQIRGFIVDYGLPTKPQFAVETVHKVLDLPKGSNIIGPTTLGILENYSEEDYKNFLEKYRAEMKKHFSDVAQSKPEKRKFLNGWLNRADRAHLAK